MSVGAAPGWDRVHAVVREDGSGEVHIGGIPYPVYMTTVGQARSEVMRHVVEHAAAVGQPVAVSASGPEGTSELVVHPNGDVQQAVAFPPAAPADTPFPPMPDPRSPAVSQGPAVPSPVIGNPFPPQPAGSAHPPSAPERDRRSFLVEERGDDPARHGMRGVLSRIGVHVPPSAEERAERADEAAVAQHWPGPRTVAVVNGKGGAGKTPGTVLLSSVFAAHGGSGVVAWDNNQTRGTLGWRTEQGMHDATLHDLLPQIDHFLGPTAQLADLAWYIHHQSRDRFDVLRSKPMVLADEQRISSADVDAIHAVLSKYYRLIFIDSGNDESDPMWLRMIDHTDQLVVATTTRDDHAEAGALLLEALAARDPRSAELARGAVVLVSQADPKATPAEMRKVARGYRSLAREVVTVPFDPGMVDGRLSLRSLRPATQRAWLAAGAAVARGF
ncbi:ATPase [Myceligenerans xiligouense]|uniref:MinD-like ATPase involved in chromosome partitioning or flagellar assembly n=1 Tax=Myceligenerans xiligouense TaxID=253184 RepID=A0A3N4Z8P2_9MICO|nr:ATPase [Myceligenerans xiligouense]RPF21732.1 MinD-like ATPase involved in chromosome partitioning or flagellar assembly [Myceligenerans xiligouense]